MGESVVLDPYMISTANAPLWLHSTNLDIGMALSADSGAQYPTPDQDVTWVFSGDTEGELPGRKRPHNRVIPVTLQIVEPPDGAATNLCTNPVAGSASTTGWTNNSLTSFLSRVYQIQDPNMPFLSGFDTAFLITGDASGDNAAFSLAVTNGQTYTVSMWNWVNSGTQRLEVFTAVPALFASGANFTNGVWNRNSLTFTANATATWTVRVSQNAAGTSNGWFTGVLITTGSTVQDYFDGDMAGCVWTGTRNASTSTRKATGGARYAGIRGDLESKIAKLNEFGGTYRRTTPTSEHINFDVRAARLVSWEETVEAELGRYIKAQLEFNCRPYGYGLEVAV